MFNPVGLFKEIPCPEGDRCTLLNCIFSHNIKASPVLPLAVAKSLSASCEPTPHRDDERLRKKRRIDTTSENESSRSENVVEAEMGTNQVELSKDHIQNRKKHVSHSDIQNLRSMVRTVSPPPIARQGSLAQDRGNLPKPSDPTKPAKSLLGNMQPPKQVKKETLNPRLLPKAPASHAVRLSVLVKLHDAMVHLNNQVAKDENQSKKALVLSPDELVTMALDEEEKIANEDPMIYLNVVKLRIMKLRKMTQGDWEQDISAYLRSKIVPKSLQTPKRPEVVLSTGLNVKEEIVVLSRLVASFEGLDQLGYVTSVPTKQDIQAAKSGTQASQGWEQCDRCRGRFQVFPGRREDGLLASGGSCTYHHSKPLRPQRQKTDHIVGQKESYYPCCNETVGTSAGCTKSQWHVFKVSETKRLAAVFQFEKTPHQPNKGVLPPVCFDCEMGYTTLGLELIRLTAITWPDGEELLDVLVRPIGEILDLNSRYSGVRPEHYAKAVPYTNSPYASRSADGTATDTSSLPLVESPAAARALLFQHLQPDTPLIGHAIENDLNACRIIHPTIVDTALLYPHPSGLSIRFSLRILATKFLGRHIQTGGGDKGHDSMEDAKATGDLVRVKVRETWKVLKRLGWRIEVGKLIGPGADGQGEKKIATTSLAKEESRKPGTGLKIRSSDDGKAV